MKYCIIYTGEKKITKETIDAVGFYQWANALDGDICHIDEILHNYQDGDYDLVHFQLLQKNLHAIQSFRDKIGVNSKTKIMASMDISPKLWKVEFVRPQQLMDMIKCIDFVTATEYTIAKCLEEASGRKVFDIPYPADLNKIRSYKTNCKRKTLLTVLNDTPIDQYEVFKNAGFKFLKPLLYIFKKKISLLFKKVIGIDLSFIYFNDQERSDKLLKLEWDKIKKSPLSVINVNEKELCNRLSGSKLVLSMYKEPINGKLIIYAAALGCQLVGQATTEATRRCYAPNAHSNDDYKNFKGSFWWLIKEDATNRFLPLQAENKVEFYNHSNMRKKMMDFVWDVTREDCFLYARSNKLQVKTDYFESMKLISGPSKIKYDLFECILVCPIRNGDEFISTYLAHYRSMGIKHFIFIDNGSDDDTIQLLSNQSDITLYKTSLEFSHYESEIRRVIIEEHCRGNWVLCTDVDELFDFPFSDKINLTQFLQYQYKKGYTAVTAHMLDMFGDEKVYKSNALIESNDLRELYPYYDISKLEKEPYFDRWKGYNCHNTIPNENIVCSYGGVRNHHFKPSSHKIMNLKHSLLFVDENIEPFVNPHFSNKVKISDVSCVLRHYKFTKSLKERIYKFFDYKSDNPYHNEEYKAYYNVLKDKDSFDLCSEFTERYGHVNQLIKSNFVAVSEDYNNWVEVHKSKKNQFDRNKDLSFGKQSISA